MNGYPDSPRAINAVIDAPEVPDPLAPIPPKVLELLERERRLLQAAGLLPSPPGTLPTFDPTPPAT